MTTVNVLPRNQSLAGLVRAAGAHMKWKPNTAALLGEGRILLPESLRVDFAAADTPTTSLEPCDGTDGWCWEVALFIPGEKTAVLTRHVLVPDSATAVAFDDLQDVDPTTLVPVGRMVGQWRDLLTSLESAREAVPDGVTNVDDETFTFTHAGAPVLGEVTLPRGPRGYPGVDAMPAVEAVGEYIRALGSPARSAVGVAMDDKQLPLPGFGGFLQTLSALRSGDPVSVMAAIPDARKSAILDGTTTYNATAPIQDLLDDGGATSNAHIEYPRGVFRHGNLRLRDKRTFRLLGKGARVVLEGDGSGTNGVGFELVGDIEDFEASGFHIVGDGDKTHKHAGFWSNSGQSFRDLRLRELLIERVRVGVSINANLGGYIDGFSVTDFVLRDIVGHLSGEGYGIHVAYENAGSTRGLIARGRIYRASRHAVYVARASDLDIVQVMSIGHRTTLTPEEANDPNEGLSKVRAAFNIARSAHLRMVDCTGMEGKGGVVTLAPNPEQVSGVTLFDIGILGCHFRRPLDSLPMLVVGDLSPSTTSPPTDVLVKRNDFWADYAATGQPATEAVQHNSGKGVMYEENHVVMHGVDRTASAFNIFNRQEAAGGSLYNDDLALLRNTGRMTTPNGSLCRLIRLDSTVSSSGARVLTDGNESFGDAQANPVALVAAVTNKNLRVRTPGGECVGIYTPGDTTPSVSRGITMLNIANTAATSITNLADGQEGQVVVLRFADGNTTLVNSTVIRLTSGTNYVGANRRTITLVFRSGEWCETARANN